MIPQSKIEDINKMIKAALGEGAGSCHACGQDVAGGMEIGVVAFREAGSPAFAVQYVLCEDHLDEYSTGFTLGVREVVVRGRFGWCSFDEHELCPIIVSPMIVGVSEASTTSMRDVPDDSGVSVEFGDRLLCEGGGEDGAAVPEMRKVMALPGECWVEQTAADSDDEQEVSVDGE
jgi:hypothetical protein